MLFLVWCVCIVRACALCVCFFFLFVFVSVSVRPSVRPFSSGFPALNAVQSIALGLRFQPPCDPSYPPSPCPPPPFSSSPPLMFDAVACWMRPTSCSLWRKPKNMNMNMKKINRSNNNSSGWPGQTSWLSRWSRKAPPSLTSTSLVSINKYDSVS